MTSDTDVGELLVRWHESRQVGKHVSAEELCAGHPEYLAELQRRMQAIEAMEKRLGLGTITEDEEAPETPEAATGSELLPPPAGLRIPGYVLLGVLDQGGMGIVYKARQVELRRTVALKMIRGETQARPQQLARFRSEAAAIAQLQHPSIVQIYEVGESEGRPYFSMEFVEGGSLAQRLAGEAMAPREAAALVATLAEAIQFAHQRGVIHRDLKPGNVLLCGAASAGSGVRIPGSSSVSGLIPVPKIADFGLAKQLNGESGNSGANGQTQSGAILGTPSYMAPEQAAGKTREVGPAADIYALGAILYETLTGRPPFAGGTPLETLLLVVTTEPTPPSRERPAIPRELETICLKCLEKAPGGRYATAAALADDLRRFLEGMPIAARSTSPLRRALKWARRRPEAAALAGVLLFTALGMTGWSAWAHYREQQEARRTAIKLAPRAREILHQYCYSCHGQQPKPAGNLDVLDHARLTAPGAGLIIDRDVHGSRLIHRIEDGSMPPEEEEEFPRMSSDEIEVLKKWVAGGAPPFPDTSLPAPAAEPSPLSIEVKKILDEKCSECHRFGNAKNGIKILNHDLLVSKRKLVIPGDPLQSPLFQALHSKDPKKQMPPESRGGLSDEEIDAIRKWIGAGAPAFPRVLRSKPGEP